MSTALVTGELCHQFSVLVLRVLNRVRQALGEFLLVGHDLPLEPRLELPGAFVDRRLRRLHRRGPLLLDLPPVGLQYIKTRIHVF